jgi:hypothetical protein
LVAARERATETKVLQARPAVAIRAELPEPYRHVRRVRLEPVNSPEVHTKTTERFLAVAVAAVQLASV